MKQYLALEKPMLNNGKFYYYNLENSHKTKHNIEYILKQNKQE
jgi:hypothetical protein